MSFIIFELKNNLCFYNYLSGETQRGSGTSKLILLFYLLFINALRGPCGNGKGTVQCTLQFRIKTSILHLAVIHELNIVKLDIKQRNFLKSFLKPISEDALKTIHIHTTGDCILLLFSIYSMYNRV